MRKEMRGWEVGGRHCATQPGPGAEMMIRRVADSVSFISLCGHGVVWCYLSCDVES